MRVPRPRSDTPAAAHARDLIEQTVRRRATHETRDQVGDTRSYANMERTLKREYWGRFLIELLQNARDAWNSNHADATDGVVLVRLTSEPALIVANQGEGLRPEVLLDSISKFGESTKEFGAAIGHKGIGFKGRPGDQPDAGDLLAGGHGWAVRPPSTLRSPARSRAHSQDDTRLERARG